MTFKNEENERDKSYTLISCTKQKVFLGCCKIPKLSFCFSSINYSELREIQTEMMYLLYTLNGLAIPVNPRFTTLTF